jgi:predicted site-specific integrase-resolvase
MKNLSEYVKTAEGAEILGISQTTLRKWAESGQIPVKRNPINGYRLFAVKIWRSSFDHLMCQLRKENQGRTDG